jgi:hypothetical protein
MKRILVALSLLSALLLPRQLAGQTVEGRFYPEKQTYLVSEPCIVVLDLRNPMGTPVFVSVSCAWLDTRFEAPSAPNPLPAVGLFGCRVGGWGGDCAGSSKEILPGEDYRRRYLLDGDFRLDEPGRYKITAHHKVDFYKTDISYRVIRSQEIVCSFYITLVKGDQEELEAAYQPLLSDVNGPPSAARTLALRAILQNPPPFLEHAILSMADDPDTAGASITGLQKLATPRAKAKLAELSGAGNPESIRQAALQALGELGDPAYCSLMLNVAEESHQYPGLLRFAPLGIFAGQESFLSHAVS